MTLRASIHDRDKVQRVISTEGDYTSQPPSRTAGGFFALLMGMDRFALVRSKRNDDLAGIKA